MKQLLFWFVLVLAGCMAYCILAPEKIADPTLEDYVPLQRILANEYKEKGAPTEKIEAEINVLQKKLDTLEKERKTCEASIQANEELLKQLGIKSSGKKEIDELKLELRSLEDQKQFEQSQIANAQKKLAALESRYNSYHDEERSRKRNQHGWKYTEYKTVTVRNMSWADYQSEKSRCDSDIRMSNMKIKKIDEQIKGIRIKILHSGDLDNLENREKEAQHNIEKAQNRLAEIQRQSEEKTEMLKQKQAYVVKVKAFYEDEEKLLKAGLLVAYGICQSLPSPKEAYRFLSLAKKSSMESWADFYSYLNVHEPDFLDTLKDGALKKKYQEYLTNFKLSTIEGRDFLIDLAAVEDDDLAQIEAIILEKYQK